MFCLFLVQIKLRGKVRGIRRMSQNLRRCRKIQEDIRETTLQGQRGKTNLIQVWMYLRIAIFTCCAVLFNGQKCTPWCINIFETLIVDIQFKIIFILQFNYVVHIEIFDNNRKYSIMHNNISNILIIYFFISWT